MHELTTANFQLTSEETNRYYQLKAKCKSAWIDLAVSLLEIHNRRLYLIEYDTFEDFCRSELQIARSRAYQFIESAKVISNVHNCGHGVVPSTESQARPLTPLVPEIQREAWAETVQRHGENITAAKVEEVAKEWQPISDKIKEEVEANNRHDIFSPPPRPREEIVLDVISTTKRAHVSNNSGNNEWYTPSEYIEAARLAMGSIDLDPASSEIANRTVRAEMFFTEEEDGLAQQWYGNIWMNPPYAQPLISQFIQKLSEERFEQAIVLVNNATETKWGSTLLGLANAVCFPTGRIRFVSPNGSLGDSPLQGQMIAYVGDNTTAFLRHFKQFGVCLLSEG